MMQRTRYVLIVIIALLAAGAIHAQEVVGRIESIDGFAEIDAFGSGSYIRAREGDRLYARSVIRTDLDTWVEIEVGGATYSIASLSETSVSSFATERRRSAGDGFLRRLIGGLGRALAPPRESQERLGTGRASEAAQSDNGLGGFVLDVDVDEEFALGVQAIDEGDFRLAMEHFSLIEFPEDGTFELEEFYVSKTWALMGMGDFSEAVRTAFSYYDPFDPFAASVNDLGPRLQLLVSIAAWYSEDDDLARDASIAYVDEVGLDAADAQGIAIAILTQRSSNAGEAARLEREARDERPGEDWDALLDA